MDFRLESILPFIEKPGRYTGGEINSVVKDISQCRLRFALAFPDTYEIGMSHLGLQILYSILNGEKDIAAERVFAPWPDMESSLRSAGVSLASHETRTPLAAFDIIGFSLQYELSYTNVLNMLDLGGIPLFAAERTGNAPFIIAGGPCAFNPEPMAVFFDAIAIGEGEELILEIARTVMEGKGRGLQRDRILENLAALEGVYVPHIHTHGEVIKKRTIPDLNLWAFPEKPVLPLIQAVHDRINLEIARGCTRGCRFCQAGMVWRPVRERTPDILNQMAKNMLASTGCEEISLLSLSSGDYTCIESFLPDLMDRYYSERVAISLPSLRVESLSPRLIEAIKRVRKTSFTLAPEAGTERLRKIINKGNSEADLLNTAGQVFSAGWKLIKLYFMLGLPGETEEDLEGIIDLSYKVLREGKNKKQVNVSLSTFVPKPHTPFQWHRQIGSDEVLEKQEFFRKRLRNRNLVFKWHDRRMSLLEGLLSRGDRAVAPVIATAFRKGCRFDGWSDRLRFDLWEEAIQEQDLNINNFLRERSIDDKLPWDHVDCGLDKPFLIREYRKALEGIETADCRRDRCHNCGACGQKIKMMAAAESDRQKPSLTSAKEGPSVIQKYRIHFAKEGRMRFLSHLETASALIRGIRQAGISFEHTKGFHPHPKISFAFALSVGVESRSEFADIQIVKNGMGPNEMLSVINGCLPSGLAIRGMSEISSLDESLFKSIHAFCYEMDIPENAAQYPMDSLAEKLEAFRTRDEFVFQKELKGKKISRDMKLLIEDLSLDRELRKINLKLRNTSTGGVKPIEVLMNVFGIDEETAKIIRIVKIDTMFVIELCPLLKEKKV